MKISIKNVLFIKEKLSCCIKVLKIKYKNCIVKINFKKSFFILSKKNRTKEEKVYAVFKKRKLILRLQSIFTDMRTFERQ